MDTVAEEARALLGRASRLTPHSPEPLQVRRCVVALCLCDMLSAAPLYRRRWRVCWLSRGTRTRR